MLKNMYLKLEEIQNYFCIPSKLGSLTLKPAAFEDAYLHLVASKASGERILNTVQLHNIKQLLNAYKQFKSKENNSIYNFSLGNFAIKFSTFI